MTTDRAGDVHFEVDGAGIVRTTMRGTITVHEAIAHTRARAAAGVLGSPQVIDGREAQLELTTDDLREIAELVGRLRKGTSPSRTAFVAQGDFAYGMARMYAALAQRDDPGFAVFRTMEEAERWIAEKD